MTYKAVPPSKNVDSMGHRPKRFWKEVEVKAVEGGFGVMLDGRGVKTPQGAGLVLPNANVANLVAAEWSGVVEHVDYAKMVYTRLGFAAVDRLNAPDEALDHEVARYASTDLLCYPSTYPQALKDREAAIWGPILAWAETDLGLHFDVHPDVVHGPQSVETIKGAVDLVHETDAFSRAGIMLATPLLGSLILALALWKGRVIANEAFAASRIGEDFQAQTWGHDAEVTQKAEDAHQQLLCLEMWFDCLRS